MIGQKNYLESFVHVKEEVRTDKLQLSTSNLLVHDRFGEH